MSTVPSETSRFFPIPQAGIEADVLCSHGYYAIVVDNGQVQYLNGYSTNAEFQTPLFESKDLSAGMHQLLIVNQNRYGDQPDPKNVCG